MGTVYGSRHVLQWGNPYTSPPGGLKRIQLVVDDLKPGHRRRTPAELLERLEELGGIGCGWCIAWDPIEKLPKTRSLMSKQRQRRKNLWKRCEKYPLFAEEFYKEEIEKRRDYFGVHTKKIEMPPK